MRRFLEHAKIFGTCLTLNFVVKSTLQEFVFMKFFDVSSFFCSDFLQFLTLGFVFRLRPTKIFWNAFDIECCGQVNLAGTGFHAILGCLSFFCSDFLWFLTLRFVFGLRPGSGICILGFLRCWGFLGAGMI